MRIDKFLTETGTCTRSEAGKAVRRGDVLLNGRAVRSASEQMDPETDTLVFRGEPIVYRKFTYIVLNKPEGVVSATEDGDVTVLDLLPEQLQRLSLFPCGRLDKYTVGFVLLTNNGALAHRLLSPKHHVEKCYRFAARSPLSYTGTVSSYLLTITNEDYASLAKESVEDALSDIFSDSNAYTVVSMSEMLDTMTSMINVVIGILAVIAGISLVVGGIGIMNIMLVSVTERTREIGIRKALGAKEGAIMRQFVIEAATTSALGGLIGIGLGYLLSAVATQAIAALMETAIVVSPSVTAVMIAFGISAGIGILFGYLPAKKAARLNPIEALRYD